MLPVENFAPCGKDIVTLIEAKLSENTNSKSKEKIMSRLNNCKAFLSKPKSLNAIDDSIQNEIEKEAAS